MKIDYKNKEIIRSRDVYVHDSTFEGFTYHEEQQKLSFRMKNWFLNKYFKIDFYNTINIDCKLCKFWGGGDSVADFNLCDEGELTEELKKIQTTEGYIHSLLDDETNYIESYFIMNSGDEIRIACEYIIFEEEPLKEDN